MQTGRPYACAHTYTYTHTHIHMSWATDIMYRQHTHPGRHRLSIYLPQVIHRSNRGRPPRLVFVEVPLSLVRSAAHIRHIRPSTVTHTHSHACICMASMHPSIPRQSTHTPQRTYRHTDRHTDIDRLSRHSYICLPMYLSLYYIHAGRGIHSHSHTYTYIHTYTHIQENRKRHASIHPSIHLGISHHIAQYTHSDRQTDRQ